MSPPMTSHKITRAADVTAADDIIDHIELPYQGRLLRRKRLQTAGGLSVMLDLAQVTDLRQGDLLVLDDGRCVEIRAAAEEIYDITAPDLVRIAWHVGNRHTPCEILPDRLRVLRDHVMRDMLAHLGATVADVVAPFNPEGGAYGHGRTFGHSHGPADHAHSHDHNHDHSHDH